MPIDEKELLAAILAKSCCWRSVMLKLAELAKATLLSPTRLLLHG